MLSGVLRSKRAEAVNIAIMRTFVRLRQTLDVSQLSIIRSQVIEQLEAEAGGRQERFAWWSVLQPSGTRFAIFAAGVVVAVGLVWCLVWLRAAW